MWNGGEVRLKFWELSGASGVIDKIGRSVPFGDMILMLKKNAKPFESF